MGRILWRACIVLLALAAATAAGLFSFRAWRQHEVASRLAIRSANGIDEEKFVRIGGIDQFVTVRGEDRANPVILFVHGGPGDSMVPFAELYRPWERYFTVVQWDQRGAGKTFGLYGRTGEGPMTIDRIVRDGIEVAEYLRARLHKKKIVLLAHSWGTVPGIQMVKRRPDLFAAYVGTGQVVAKEEKEEVLYSRTMEKARAAHDRDGIARLRSVGPPPYKSQHDLLVEREVSGRYDVPSERGLRRSLTPVVLYYPGYSLLDIRDFLHAPDYAAGVLYRPQLAYDARKLGRDFALPFFIFEGEADSITPPDLARAYFDAVKAPAKGFVQFRNAGHGAIETMPDEFLSELLKRVRPLAVRAG
jgi:pimeloyl-ACP methyl ester carboxylesterase